ncbi:hypothetical protein WA1_23870 [Scytonema hofmannii PCC 7110]|jgi:hypothetical protein|uniref:DUF4383 domain-containing protein n=1 Tax=Scytonema hofmannii PCC 7110 TaxID=128403 RepID=A0A139X7S9_9CYAN|nr:DUF4383 domain-containing protein [Scytonema hofmannii]KYC40683.1 hypothetical protein WA1_23870 [Scytonema hofmannii PCC 7110]
MGVRYFALISGIVYVLLGLFGFIPGMVATPGTGGPEVLIKTGYGYLLELFAINVIHNIVHIAVGVWGLISYRRYIRSRSYARGLAVFYGVLAIMGLLPVLNTVFGIIPVFGHNVWLHAVTALIAAYFGFKAPDAVTLREQERSMASGRSRNRF